MKPRDRKKPWKPILLIVGVVVAAIVAVASFALNVAPAGLETDPNKGATYKQVSSPKPAAELPDE